ncbi:hypothetical protein [Blastococcus colisei]|uniref:hypothetical protein n=1 Tax=Blastococcus colisei TaxID=1564162 RepID=UPI001477371E|nr:hypothetical protein [Blastococcus colisei]
MDVLQVWRALVRRWRLALPLVFLALATALFVRGGVEPGYTANASVIVLPPSEARINTESGVQTVPVNPLLGSSSSTQLAAQVLAILAQEPEFRQQAMADESLAAYSVETATRSPILNISIESKDPLEATGATQRVIEQMSANLDKQQEAVQADQRLGIQVLSQPAISSVDNSQLRAFVATLAIGLLLTVAVTVLFDGVTGRRKRHADQRVRGSQ